MRTYISKEKRSRTLLWGGVCYTAFVFSPLAPLPILKAQVSPPPLLEQNQVEQQTKIKTQQLEKALTKALEFNKAPLFFPASYFSSVSVTPDPKDQKLFNVKISDLILSTSLFSAGAGGPITLNFQAKELSANLYRFKKIDLQKAFMLSLPPNLPPLRIEENKDFIFGSLELTWNVTSQIITDLSLDWTRHLFQDGIQQKQKLSATFEKTETEEQLSFKENIHHSFDEKAFFEEAEEFAQAPHSSRLQSKGVLKGKQLLPFLSRLSNTPPDISRQLATELLKTPDLTNAYLNEVLRFETPLNAHLKNSALGQTVTEYETATLFSLPPRSKEGESKEGELRISRLLKESPSPQEREKTEQKEKQAPAALPLNISPFACHLAFFPPFEKAVFTGIRRKTQNANTPTSEDVLSFLTPLFPFEEEALFTYTHATVDEKNHDTLSLHREYSVGKELWTLLSVSGIQQDPAVSRRNDSFSLEWNCFSDLRKQDSQLSFKIQEETPEVQEEAPEIQEEARAKDSAFTLTAKGLLITNPTQKLSGTLSVQDPLKKSTSLKSLPYFFSPLLEASPSLTEKTSATFPIPPETYLYELFPYAAFFSPDP